MEYRPLPRSLDPLPGEGLDGYVLRLAYRLERTPYRIAALTGLITRGSPHMVPAGLITHLPPGPRETFALVTRLSSDEVANLCLSVMADRYPPVSPDPEARGVKGSSRRNRWVFERATRYCPQCLAGDGSSIQNSLGGPWRKTWRLPVAFACIKHTRFLEHLCPSCARPAHDSLTDRGDAKQTAFAMLPQTGLADLHPTHCRLPLTTIRSHARHIPICGAALANPATQPPLVAEGVAIELQQHLDNLLHPAAPGQALSCGTPATACQYFVDLRLITQLIRASWPLAQDLLKIPEPFGVAISEDHDQVQEQQADHQASLRTLYDTPPLDTKTCAALLLTARRLLDAGPPPELTEKVLHLLSYDQRPPSKATWTRDILIRQPDCSPGLRKALVPVLQGYTSVPGRRHRGLNTPVGRTSYKTRHVAQFLQEDWYQRHFARMDGVNPLHLRRAAAIRLCQLSAGGPVSRAAEQLGIPGYLANQSIKLLNLWVSNRPERRKFETALRRLAEELDSASPPHRLPASP
jgi:hypothetical protein